VVDFSGGTDPSMIAAELGDVVLRKVELASSEGVDAPSSPW
jgi:hypothetical protein